VCCSVLQCVAVCCSVLQCVAVCCSVLQCVAVCHSVLRCVAVCCSVSQCVAVCHSVLQCVVVCCSVLQCVATLYHTYLTKTAQPRGALPSKIHCSSHTLKDTNVKPKETYKRVLFIARISPRPHHRGLSGPQKYTALQIH